MSGISKEIHGGKEIFVIDFSDCKEDQMIGRLIEFRTRLIASGNPELILSIFNDKSFATPKFMHAFRTTKREEAIPFIKKQAVVGLSEIKKVILKGYNLLFNRNIRAFDSKQDAIRYLLSD